MSALSDLLTGNSDAKRRAEKERIALEQARQKSLQRAAQSTNVAIAQKARNKIAAQPARTLAKPKQNFFDKTRDIFDANSAMDKFKRQEAYRPLDYATEQREKGVGERSINLNPVQRAVNFTRATAESVAEAPIALGRSVGNTAATFSDDYKSAQESEQKLRDIERQTDGTMFKLLKNGTPEQQQRAANYLNKSQPAKTGMNDLRTQIASENDPRRLAAAGASLVLDLATLGVAGASKQGIKTAYQGAKAAQVANNANKARQVTSGVIAGTKRYGIDTAKTAAMGGASGGLSAYINDPNATAKQALSGVGMGAALGGALPTAFIGASYAPTVVKGIQNADLGAKAVQAGRVLRDIGKPTGQALQNLQTAKANIDTQITDLLQKRSIAQTRKPDLVPILDKQIDDLYSQSDSLTRKMNMRSQGGGYNTNPKYDDLAPQVGKTDPKLVTRFTPGKDLGSGKYQMAKAELLDENGKVLESTTFSREPNLKNPLDKRNVEDMQKELAREYINRKHFNDPKNQINTGWYKGTDRATPVAQVGKTPFAKTLEDVGIKKAQTTKTTDSPLKVEQPTATTPRLDSGAPLSQSGTQSKLKVQPLEKQEPLSYKDNTPKAKDAPKPIKTVFDTDKIYQSSTKARKEVIDAAVGEEALNQKEALDLWKRLNSDIKSMGGINNKADELQGGYASRRNQIRSTSTRKLDDIAQELSSTGKYGDLTPQQLIDLLENKPTVSKIVDIKNKVINDLESSKHPYSEDYLNAQKAIDTRRLELEDLPVTARVTNKPDTKMSNSDWQSLQETAPFNATTKKQAIGQELAAVRKELEASNKLATQMSERQKINVITGKENVASKMRETNAKMFEDIKNLQKRERELAKQYAMESPVDNRVNMSDPKNVTLDGINEAFNSSLKDKSKKKMFEQLSKDYLGDVEAAKITADKRALDFTNKHQLSDADKLDVIKATDDSTVKGLTPKVKEAVDELHRTYDELYNYFTKEKGVDMGYQHDYYPREYVNVKTGDQMTAAEYNLLQKASARTKGRSSDALADWKLKYTDPADGLKSYYSNLEKAAAGRKYMQELENQGLVVKGDGAPMSGYRPIIAEGIQPSGGGVYYAKKEVADKLNTMFGSQEATNMLGKALEKGEGLNSFWQSVVLSGGVPNTPLNAFGFMQVMKEGMALHPIKASKAMWGGVNKNFAQQYFERKSPVMAMMAKEGISTRYSLSEGAKKGLGRTKDAFKDSKAQGINQAWNELTNDATFGRFMPLLMTEHFDNIYKHGLKKGLSPEQASKIAGNSTKNFYGITDLYNTTTRSKYVSDAAGTFLFAPRFRESMLNFWVKNAKAVDPRGGFKNLRSPEYRDNAKFMAAAALTYAAYDVANYEMNGTHLWQNPDGKKDKLLIPNATSDGKTVGIPFLPSIATVPRNAAMGVFNLATGNVGEAGKNISSFLSMPVRTAGELLTNENYFGQPIVDKDANPATRVAQTGSYVAKSTLQPWVREGLNVAGQGLPDGVKDALGVKKKGAFETASNALEAPLRFYDPKYMRGGGDNFKTASGKTNGEIKSQKTTKLSLEDAQAMQKKEYGGKYAGMNKDEIAELAKTDKEAAAYQKSWEATTAAYGKTPDLPSNLPDSAKKVLTVESRLTSDGKEKWKKTKNTDKQIADSLKRWNNGNDVPVTNEIAKEWAEYQKDYVDKKLDDISAKTRKKSILTKAYKTSLDDISQSFYKLGDDAMRSELESGTISKEQMDKIIETDNTLTKLGLQKYTQVGKKLRAELGYGQIGGSSSKKSSGGRKRSGGRKSTKSYNYFAFQPTSVNKSLRQLVEKYMA